MGKSIRDVLKHQDKKVSAEEEAPLHQAEEGDGDGSATIEAMSVKITHPSGHEYSQTEIVANIAGSKGLVSKRMVVPGSITANKLSALLEGIEGW